MEDASTFEVSKFFSESLYGRLNLTPGEGKIALWFGAEKSDARAVAVEPTDATAFAKVVAANEDAQQAYCGVALRETGAVQGHAHGSVHQLLDARIVFFDWDCGKPGYPATKEVLLAQVLSFCDVTGLMPHLVVETAQGFHGYYLLSEPLDDPERMTIPARMEAAFTEHLALSGYTMDQGVTTQMTRLARIPGTWNRKTSLAAPVRTEIHSIGEHDLYSPDALLAQLPDSTAVSSLGQGALPIVYDERAGAELARALPINRILTMVHGWTLENVTVKGVSLWDAHCDAAESNINARSVWGVRQLPHQTRTDDRAEAVYVYSTTTAAEYGVPADTRLTSFVWIAHRYFGGDYRAAVGLAAAFSDRPDELLEVLRDAPTTALLADLARQASSEWPEGLSREHMGRLGYNAVAADVAKARGYATLSPAHTIAAAVAATPVAIQAEIVSAGIGALQVPVHSLRGEITSTLRLDRPAVIPPAGKGDQPIVVHSLAGAEYTRKSLDMNPVCRRFAANADVPLVITSADYRGRGMKARTDVQHGQIHADAIASAGLREGIDLAVASLARWEDGLFLRGTAGSNFSREDLLVDDWGRLELQGRTVYIAGRAHWRRSESLIALATLLEGVKGATVKVVDIPQPEAGPTSAGGDNSPYAISDYLAEAVTRSDAKPLTGLLDAALTLTEATWQATPLDDTEIGRADLLGDDLRRNRSHKYNATDKLWMENTGSYWRASPAANPNARALDVLRKAGAKLEGAVGLTRPLGLVEKQPGIAVATIDMGTAGRELNVLNGVVDLNTGMLRERTIDDVHLTVVPAEYNPSAPAPRWREFLSEITLNDSEYVAYLQRHVGMLLVGEVLEEAFFIAVGGGGNGKSVFYGTIMEMMASYASAAPTEMLTGKPAPHQIADLFGRRFIMASETEEGDKLSTSSMKDMSKRDTLTGARKFGHAFDFKSTHTPCLMTNHYPVIHDTTDGTWRRIKVLPFDLKLSKDKVDKTLPAQLLNEMEGILAWAVEGAVHFLANGLGDCKRVNDATNKYSEDQDLMGRYLREQATVTGNKKDFIQRSKFNSDLEAWLTSSEAGLKKGWTVKTVTEKLEGRGVTVKRKGVEGFCYIGIKEGGAPMTEDEISEFIDEMPAPDSPEILTKGAEVVEAAEALRTALHNDEMDF